MNRKFPCEFSAEVIQIVENGSFEEEIRRINQLSFLPGAITKLESDALNTEKQIEIVNEILHKLSFDKTLKERFENILKRNPDLLYFINFNMVTSSEEEKIFSFVPLTTVSVERSFSKYKDLLTDKRKNLLQENIERHLIIYFNS